MESSVLDGYVPVIAAISGAIIGFLLSFLSQWYATKKNEKKVTNSVRTLIMLEIEQNLLLLDEFINKAYNVEKEPTEYFYKLAMAKKFIILPFPPINKIMWEKQVSMLPSSFDSTELTKLSKLYNNLNFIEIIHSKAYDLEMKKDNRIKNRHPEYRDGYFTKKALEYWENFDKIAKGLLEEGNPLK